VPSDSKKKQQQRTDTHLLVDYLWFPEVMTYTWYLLINMYTTIQTFVVSI